MNIVRFGTPLDSRTIKVEEFKSVHKEIETAFTVDNKEVYCVNVIECQLSEPYDTESIIGEQTIKTKNYKHEKSAWNYFDKDKV